MVEVTILLPTRLKRRHWQSVVTFPSSPVSLVVFLHLETFPTVISNAPQARKRSFLCGLLFLLRFAPFLVQSEGLYVLASLHRSKNNQRAAATQTQFLPICTHLLCFPVVLPLTGSHRGPICSLCPQDKPW